MRQLPDVAALDLLPDAVILIAADGTIVAVNTVAARLLGVEPASVVGVDFPRTYPLRDEAGMEWWTGYRPVDVDGRFLPRAPEQSLRLHVGERSRPVTLTAARLFEPDGTVTHLVLCLRRAERRERLDAARSELVSTVSHELRSPLTSVKGFTKTLLAKWERFTDDQKRQMLATVNEDADRVTRLLGELLDVSRIDAGRLQLRRQMVQVPEVVSRVITRLSVTDGDSEIVNLVDIDIPKLYSDPDKVEQVFTNLLENALKYGAGTISIASRVDEDSIEFSVIDEGDGIDSRYLTHVFTKFFRRPGERRMGTGLGLYITKGIVDAHGGRIWAESPPESGAQFRFTLPRGGLELAGISVPPHLDESRRRSGTAANGAVGERS